MKTRMLGLLALAELMLLPGQALAANRLDPGSPSATEVPTPPAWWVQEPHRAPPVVFQWKLQQDRRVTVSAPMNPPPFVLDPNLVSMKGELRQPRINDRGDEVPTSRALEDHPGKATRDALRREDATWKREREQLRMLLSLGPAETPPLHGPRPDPPEHAVA